MKKYKANKKLDVIDETENPKLLGNFFLFFGLVLFILTTLKLVNVSLNYYDILESEKSDYILSAIILFTSCYSAIFLIIFACIKLIIKRKK